MSEDNLSAVMEKVSTSKKFQKRGGGLRGYGGWFSNNTKTMGSGQEEKHQLLGGGDEEPGQKKGIRGKKPCGLFTSTGQFVEYGTSPGR